MKSQRLLAVVWGIGLVASAITPVMAAPIEREKVIHLGAVNGVMQGNQVVEVVRTLPDPVLFELTRSDVANMPGYLLVRQAIASDGVDGGIQLRQVRQVMTSVGQLAAVSFTYGARLWVDGQQVATSWQQRGDDVVLGLPSGAQNISVRADSPVQLQLPKGYRGELSLALEIDGWRMVP